MKHTCSEQCKITYKNKYVKKKKKRRIGLQYSGEPRSKELWEENHKDGPNMSI